MNKQTKELLLKTIGRSCRRWRRSMDFKLKDIAHDTGYSISLTQYFERGENNNAIIFMWYITHGFNPQKDIKTENGVIIDITNIFEMG